MKHAQGIVLLLLRCAQGTLQAPDYFGRVENRCNVLSAKPWLLQNSTCLSPLASNSVTRRLISWLLRRFRTLTSSLSVMPRVDQNRAGVTRWVRLTDTFHRLYLCGRAAPDAPERGYHQRRCTVMY
jgi:hypothetical protein